MAYKLLVIVNIWLAWQVNCDPPVTYKFTNVECTTNVKYCANFTCLIKAVDWNKATAVLDFHVLLPLRNVSIHLKVLKKDYSNRYQPFLIDVRFNLCDVISKRNYLFYGIYVWKMMKRYTNVNHSCPLHGHLYSRNLYMDEVSVPTFPLGFYKYALNFSETIGNKTEYLGVMNLYTQAMETVTIKRNNRKPRKNITSFSDQI